MIAEPTGTDGRPMIRKKPGVTGRHVRPVPFSRTEYCCIVPHAFLQSHEPMRDCQESL